MINWRIACLGFYLAVVGCVAPIRVHTIVPVAPEKDPVVATAYQDFRKLKRKQPLAAAGRLMEAIERLLEPMGRGETQGVDSYNYLVGRLVESLEASGRDPFSLASLELKGDHKTYALRASSPEDLEILTRQLIPVDTLRFSGRFAVAEASKPGIGAPLIAVSEGELSNRKLPNHQLTEHYRSVTALIRIDGNSAELVLADPYEVENIDVDGRRLPLAANFSAAASLVLSRSRIDRLGIVRLFQPGRYRETARITFFQPYDPERIPVLLVHGLQDTPASLVPMYLTLMQDPEIREHFQFWTFSYPSGYPYPYSAKLLRDELDELTRLWSGHKGIVLVGHSMGGLLARMMVSHADDRLWLDAFGTPPKDTPISGESRQRLEESLVFRSQSGVSRAVFMAAPHGGSEMAGQWVGRMASRLVRLPGYFADMRDDVVHALKADQAAMALERVPNSIDTLSTDSLLIQSINRLPIDPQIPYHSIIGDRGRGDTPDSSDGVVAYWSSHIEGAASEVIVPSDHMVHQHPDGIAEVGRILHEHAGIRSPER